MKKRITCLLALLCLLFACGCAKQEATAPPTAEQLAAFGVTAPLPPLDGLDRVECSEGELCVVYRNADAGTMDTAIAFLQGQGFDAFEGKAATKIEAVSGSFFSYTAQKEDKGQKLRANVMYFVRDAAFRAQMAAAGELYFVFSSIEAAKDPATELEEPREKDYILPENLRMVLQYPGGEMLAVKIDDAYYSERFGKAYFYRLEGAGYTEYLLQNGAYGVSRRDLGKYVVEYAVFGFLLDAGEMDFEKLEPGEPQMRFGRELAVFTDHHEGINETVLYDAARKLLFGHQIEIDGYSKEAHLVTVFDETVVDFGRIPLP